MKHLKRMIASALMLMVTAIMYAQTIEATGTVVDQTGEAIIGATVMEKGTTNGAITDFDGNFKISVKKGATLVVSYIGFNNQELPAAQGMKITLKEDAQKSSGGGGDWLHHTTQGRPYWFGGCCAD